jgi:hypothetical protein
MIALFLKYKTFIYAGAAGLVVAAFGFWHVARVNDAVASARTKLMHDQLVAQVKAYDDASKLTLTAVAAAQEAAGVEIKKVKENAETLLTDYRNKSVRLSIPARCPSTHFSDAAQSVAGYVDQTRAELSPAAAEFLIGEAVRSDQEVIDRNKIIDALIHIRDNTP